jgi:hypothetical protein
MGLRIQATPQETSLLPRSVVGFPKSGRVACRRQVYQYFDQRRRKELFDCRICLNPLGSILERKTAGSSLTACNSGFFLLIAWFKKKDANLITIDPG